MDINKKEIIQSALANSFFDLFYTRKFQVDHDIDIQALSIEDAFHIQDAIAEKKAKKGEKIVGYKIGCTSEAIQKQFGLNEPIYGRLFAPYIYEDGAEINLANYVNCSIEPEMVITIGTDLVGENLTDDELISAISEVRPGMELHNYRFWFSPTTSQELIASNGIWAGLVIGNEKIDPKSLTFKDEVFHVLENDEVLVREPASEIMSGLGPLESLRWLVGCLTKKGERLPAGSLVIPGSPVELVVAKEGAVLEVVIDRVGCVKAHFRTEK